MYAIYRLESLNVAWKIGRLSPRIPPANCRPSVKQFAIDHHLDLRAPLRAPLYYVNIHQDVFVEVVGWALEDVVREAISEFEQRIRPPVIETPPVVSVEAESPELAEARRARALEIQRIQEEKRTN